MRCQDEELAEQFYAWERRGRGWQVWDCPVQLEPPFRPFFGHYRIPRQSLADARRPSFFGAVIEELRGRTQEIQPQEASEIIEIEEPEAELFFREAPLTEIQVSVPADLKIHSERAVQLLCRIGELAGPVAFEIIGRHDAITIQFTCEESRRTQVYHQIQAYFPEAVLREHPNFLRDAWQGSSPSKLVVDFGLSREFMLPIRICRDFDVDTQIAIAAALADIGSDEMGVMQVIFESVRNPWSESIMRAVTDGEGHPFFGDAPDMVRQARQKIGEPLMAAVIRVGAAAGNTERMWHIVRTLGATLSQLSDTAGNELIPLANDIYEYELHADDFLLRQSRRNGMIVNAHELVSLVHLPSASVKSEKLKREEKRTRAAPGSVLGHSLVLGENVHAGKTIAVTLNAEERSRHTYVIGASGTGKSTLLLNLILQDVKSGEGIAVLDPHGDLIDQVLGNIPESRFDDVILVDPSDADYPVGVNILSAHSEIEKTLLASDLVSVFRRLSTSWGDQMTSVLGNAVLAFLESEGGGTLGDLRRFLVEAEFRSQFLRSVKDSEVVYYWQKEFPLLSGRPQAPILTRLDSFLRPKLIRNMVCQKGKGLDLGAAMNEGKILLVKLAQGAIGEENAHLLGTFLVSKIHQMAIARQEIEVSKRRPFYLYIDEFHHFATPSMASILSGARKFGLGLVLAHQELRQLGRDDEVTSAVLANPYTRICFRVGDADAKRLAEGFAHFSAQDLQNIGLGEAICRVERSDYDFNLRTIPFVSASEGSAERRGRIVELSREKYATPRSVLEKEAPPRTRESAASDAAEKETPTGGVGPKTREAFTARKGNDESGESGTRGEPLPGRGGDHHKYLQQLIKRWAEGRGYAVLIEKPILDGLGMVDVALEKDGRSIACEISVTTDAEHETANVQKCLAAGFQAVIFVSSEKKVLTAVRQELAGALSPAQLRRIKFLSPEETFSYIESLEVVAAPTRPTPDPNEILTAKEMETLLRIDVKTIYSYVQRGILPYVKMQSNVRFIRSEILKWMEDRQYKPNVRPKGNRQ